MVNILLSVAAVVVGYLLGSIPNGYLVIKLFKRADITKIGSGRTGGTNAMRAGGVLLGLLTAVLDILKGGLAVLFGRWLVPGSVWPEVLRPLRLSSASLKSIRAPPSRRWVASSSWATSVKAPQLENCMSATRGLLA